jgi:hypothetical protein
VRQPPDGEHITVGSHGGEGLLGPRQGLFGSGPGMPCGPVGALIQQR